MAENKRKKKLTAKYPEKWWQGKMILSFWGNKVCLQGIFSLVSYTRLIHCVKNT